MPLEALQVRNRVAVVLIPKEPLVAWVNSVDDGPLDSCTITLDDAREEPSVFLIPVTPSDDPELRAKRWIQRNWIELLEQMLYEWYTDPELWPRKPTLKMFHEWFDVHIHPTVMDYGDKPLQYEID